MIRPVRPAVVFFLFAVSGFTALVLEVVWTKQALLIFGNSTMSAAAVIAAYMSGLAAGSFIFGKIADKKSEWSLFLYGALEGGVGLFALCFPLILKLLRPAYGAIYVSFHENFLLVSCLRFLLSFLLLMIPTTLMGGTLPLLSRFISREGSLKERISKLYAVNLFGAVAGSFASGFFLISALGLNATSRVAAVLNLGICLYLALRLRGRGGRLPEEGTGSQASAGFREAPGEEAIDRKTAALVIFLMFLHGFTAFVAQICWTRTLTLILGSSTYAFSAMLTTFLAGLGLGSYAIARCARKNITISLTGVALLEMAAGASILLFIPVYEWLIYFFVKIFPSLDKSMTLVFLAQFSFCAAAMILPTFLLGLIFPAVIASLGRPRGIGKMVGTTYAADTMGGVLGAFLAAFFFISRFGLNGSLRLAGVLSLAAGFLVLLAVSDRSRLRAHVVKGAAIAAFSGIFLFYPWSKELFSTGVYLYSKRFAEYARLGKKGFEKALGLKWKILYYKDGISSTVSVSELRRSFDVTGQPTKVFRLNGKVEASSSGDMQTQISVSYIPLLAHPDPRDVLVIGLGSGATLSAAAEFGSVRRADCVEIEPAVAGAADLFKFENKDVLRDPRVRLIIGDGRNHLEFSPKTYDVIISEPSNPWISGVSSLFSRENYQAALSKLNSGGVYGQWLHAYQMSWDDFVMIMQTFSSVFPQVNLFRIDNADYLLLGSREPIRFDYEKMTGVLQSSPSMQKNLKYFFSFREHFLIGMFMFSNDDLRNALSYQEPRLNTDDHLFLEYSAPRHLYEDTSVNILNWLFWSERQSFLPDFYNVDEEKVFKSPDLAAVFAQNGKTAMWSKSYEAALAYFLRALELKPGDPRVLYDAARAYEKSQQLARARELYAALEGVVGWERPAKLSLKKVRIKEMIQTDPKKMFQAEHFNRIGYLAFAVGDMEEAKWMLGRAIQLDPDNPKHYTDLARYHFLRGSYASGYVLLEKAKTFGRVDRPSFEAAMDAWRLASKRIALRRRTLERSVSGVIN